MDPWSSEEQYNALKGTNRSEEVMASDGVRIFIKGVHKWTYELEGGSISNMYT